MATILPDCLEVQFGWAERYIQRAGYAASHYVTEALPYAVDSYRIQLVLSGSLDSFVDDSHWRNDEGSVLFLPPLPPPFTRGVRTLRASESIGVGFRLLLFGSISITRQLQRVGVWQPNEYELHALTELMRLLLDTAQPQALSASFVRDGTLRAILGICWEALEIDRLVNGVHFPPPMPKWLHFVMQEIRHYPGISVTELERLVGYSHSQFHRLFQQYIGVPPRVYLRQYRLDLAKRLLTTTDMSINAIAEHLGFVNASDFTRSFHRMCSVTPTEYRQSSSLAGIDF